MSKSKIETVLCAPAVTGCLLLIALIPPNVASAAENAADGALSIDEIIVTASKRPQRIIDVPYAVTAIGGQEIADRGAVDITDLQYSIPGLNISSLQPGASSIRMRGINPGSGTGLPIVGVYVDEVGISIDQQQRAGGFPLVDIERIEVLRGPQGTLYGQGSVAGTIRYLTKDPSLTEVSGFAEGNAYSQEKGGIGYRANGAIGVPLVKDKLGIRVVAGYEEFAGWIDYPLADLKDANETERYFVRSKLLAQLSETLEATLLYQYVDQKSGADQVSGLADTGVNEFRSSAGPISDESHLANLVLDLDLGLVTLTSATGYQHRNFDSSLDLAPSSPIAISTDTIFKQFSQEVRLSSNENDSPFSYVIGGWYRDFKSNVDRVGTLFGDPFPPLDLKGDAPVDSTSYAIFGDATYKFTDAFETSVGMRYYWDDREAKSSAAGRPLTVAEDSFNSFSPRVNILYRWDEQVSTYATVSKGFRSGGFNNSGSSFGPETVWNYEIGTKAALLDNRLLLDLAAYYLDYKNRQAQAIIFVNDVPFTETNNGGAASGPGIEASASVMLISGMKLDVNFSYTDLQFDKDTLDTNVGDPFSLVPDFTGSVSLSHSFDLPGSLRGFWRTDFQYAADWRSIFRSGDAVLEDFTSTSQSILNARVGIETGNVTVTLDAYNILGEDAVVFPFSPIAVNQQANRLRPRSYGLTVRYNY